MAFTLNRRCLVAALATASALGVIASTTAGGASTSHVTTKTGVLTHGAMKVTSNTVGWLLTCQPSHTLADDPITHPGIPGAGHLHDFWGNSSTTANSTLQSQESPSNLVVADSYLGNTTAPGSSCNLGQYSPGTAGDTASYWAPSLYADGTRVPPSTKAQLYYRRKPLTGNDFVPIPQDARIIVGSHTATSVDTNPGLAGDHMYWECGGDSSTHYPIPPTSCSSLLLNVVYPSCWDGAAMDHSGTNGTDNNHFAYAVDGSCPDGFASKMPQLSEKFKYVVPHSGMLLQLSADSMQGMDMGLSPTYTAHADFWNTWQPAAMRYLVDNCINAGISCGTNPITPTGS